MAQNKILSSSSVTYSSILASSMCSAPNGEDANAWNSECSPPRMSPSSQPVKTSFDMSTDSPEYVSPVNNDIFPINLDSTSDCSTTHIYEGLINSYFTYSNVTPSTTLNLHSQEHLDPDIDSSCSDISDKNDLSAVSIKHQNYPFICICSLTKSDQQLEMYSKCELCKGSVENKVRMQQDRQLCEPFLDSLSRLEDWLQMTQIAASLWNPSQTLHNEAKLALRKYEVLLKEIQEKLRDLETLNRKYWRITQISHQMLLPTTLRSRMQEVNHFWDHLQKEAEAIYQTLKSKVLQREDFDTDQDDVKLCLTEMNMELSSVEYIYNGNSTEKIQQLKAFQEDVWNNMKRVEGLLERGDQLIYESDPQDAVALEEEMTELGSYCQEIFIRLSRLQKRLVSTKLVFEDDVLDSGFEHVSSGSSDVFLDLDFEEDEIPGLPNLPPAKTAFAIDLEWDPMGDVGSSGSHDEIPRSNYGKTVRRNKYSESSVSTDSGVNNSKHRSQEDLLPVEDLPAFIAPRGTGIPEGFRKPEVDIQVQTADSKVMCCDLPGLEPGRLKAASYCASFPVDTPDLGHRTENPQLVPSYDCTLSDQGMPLASKTQMTDSHIQHNVPGQRRRQGRKKKVNQIQEVKRKHQPVRPDVSILMDPGDDMTTLKSYKSSYRCSGSLWYSIKCLTLLSLVFLLLCGSLLIFPLGHSRCPSQRFSWTLMLTYVNGPPPT
ncbi:nesprin-4 [Pyxicephalus adspersus]|uniref:nesprin-4 n=1 Tax=Pyxicephalus adspersus TaxID=30357 RepID=UPI003B5A68B3